MRIHDDFIVLFRRETHWETSWFLTQLHYPHSVQAIPCPILLIPGVWLGGGKTKENGEIGHHGMGRSELGQIPEDNAELRKLEKTLVVRSSVESQQLSWLQD